MTAELKAELKSGGLTDQYGRVATDLRVSLTDRCNLRCTYCMPAEGLDWFPREEVLTDDEVNRLLTIGVEMLGIDEIRFTGGEPLLRRGLDGIIAHAASLRTAAGTPPELSLTTNGLGLEKRAAALREAGLNRVNVSLDTLDAERFADMTRRDRLDDVLAGLAGAAATAGWPTPPRRTQYVPVAIGDDGVRPAHHLRSGSHAVGSLHLADGLAIVPADVEAVEPGDTVEVLRTHD